MNKHDINLLLSVPHLALLECKFLYPVYVYRAQEYYVSHSMLPLQINNPKCCACTLLWLVYFELSCRLDSGDVRLAVKSLTKHCLPMGYQFHHLVSLLVCVNQTLAGEHAHIIVKLWFKKYFLSLLSFEKWLNMAGLILLMEVGLYILNRQYDRQYFHSVIVKPFLV